MRSKGFTLIEIAIVLVVVGLLLSGGLVAVSGYIGRQKEQETWKIIERTKTALLAHVVANGCLPCPATLAGNGVEDATSAGGAIRCDGTCNTTDGFLPYVTLGISEEETLDPWYRPLRYAIPASLHVANAMERNGSTFPDVAAADEILINTPAGAPIITAAMDVNIAYVLASEGRRSQSVEATENGDGDDVFAFSTDQSSTFDDFVTYTSARNLVLACGSGSCGNPQ
jgi:prepilin-type N-terminal cleavage/methylation domain-containing protein